MNALHTMKESEENATYTDTTALEIVLNEKQRQLAAAKNGGKSHAEIAQLEEEAQIVQRFIDYAKRG